MDADVRRARRRRQPPEQLLRSVGLRTRRPRRALHGEPPALPRDHVGLPLRRADLHRRLVAADHRRAGLHRQRLRGARCSSPRRYKAEQAAEIVGTTPRRRAAADARRRDRRLRVVRGAVAAQPAEPLDGRIAGTDMLYSSGTTGRPKGVAAVIAGRARARGRRHADRVVLGLVVGMRACCSAWTTRRSTSRRRRCTTPRRCGSRSATQALGATVVAMEHFDTEQFLAFIEQLPRHPHPSRADDVRAHAQAARRGAGDATTCRRCECVVHAAAPCPVPVKQADDRLVGAGDPRVLRRHRGQRLRVLQQRDVAGPPGHGRDRRSTARCTSCGEDGEELPQGEIGTVYFEGGAAFEYHNDPEKTAGSRHPSGWSTLGDVGYLDADNYLYLTDRKAYMIISGGVNVYPQEAENVLVTHPKVVDVAVFGVPNEDFGEEVKAVVQPVDDARRRRGGSRARARADRLLPRRSSPTSSARARSTSAPSCPATRPASSTSVSCKMTNIERRGMKPPWER